MFRVVQKGQQPLVVCYLVGSHMDAELREILPGAAIVATSDSPLHPTLAEAFHAYGLAPSDACVLVGYSAGCQSVRWLLNQGVRPMAVVAIDGTHASIPPKEWQLSVWRERAAEARSGEVIFAATCTQQTYVEHLPGVQAFMATVHVLERIVDVELPPGTEVHDGDLHVVSYPSKAIDGDAHIAQQREALPEMLRRYIAPLYSAAPAPEPPWRDYQKAFGERLVLWYEVERAAGVREEPAGSNTGPRIRDYLAICRRRGTEKPLGLTAGAWCAAMASFGCDAVALPGEAYPAPRAAGFEMEQDAKETGDWHDVAELAAGTWEPALGDLVICARGASSWQRHVCVFLERDGDTIRTIGGNEGDQIRETVRTLEGGAEPVLGFIQLPRRP